MPATQKQDLDLSVGTTYRFFSLFLAHRIHSIAILENRSYGQVHAK